MLPGISTKDPQRLHLGHRLLTLQHSSLSEPHSGQVKLYPALAMSSAEIATMFLHLLQRKV